jgi:pimeloyl-ACP methyl ester carboxylesterase
MNADGSSEMQFHRPILVLLGCAGVSLAADVTTRPAGGWIHNPPPWTDLLDGVRTRDDWKIRREEVRQAYLDLLRDAHKPQRPPLDLQVHESVEVDGVYERRLISYAVEAAERAHAYLAIPTGAQRISNRLETDGASGRSAAQAPGKFPAVVTLHGTTRDGKEQTAALSGDPTKAYLDHLARRGYVVIAPDHFVAGHRVPPEGPYETRRFHEKHPEWTAVGKFTFEHSIAIDVLETLPEVDKSRIGVMGHSLGGQGSLFLAAYDERIKAAAANCTAGTFRHNPGVLHWSRDRWYVYFKHLRPGLLRGELPPIDFHHIMALVAPRALLDCSALNDGNRNMQKARVQMNVVVSDLYTLLGVPEQFAFYVNGYGHKSPYESRELIYAWLDAHLKPPAATQPSLLKTAGEQ